MYRLTIDGKWDRVAKFDGLTVNHRWIGRISQHHIGWPVGDDERYQRGSDLSRSMDQARWAAIRENDYDLWSHALEVADNPMTLNAFGRFPTSCDTWHPHFVALSIFAHASGFC
jgi:hypothetical protein